MEKMIFVLDNLVIKTYSKFNKNEFIRLFILTLLFFLASKETNLLIFIYLYKFSFLIFTFMGLIFILNFFVLNISYSINRKFKTIYILKYVLYLLLFLTLVCLLFLLLKMSYDIILFVYTNLIKTILVKIKDLWEGIKNTLNKGNSNLPPHNPKDPETTFYTSDSSTKKINKDLKKRAIEMRKAILANQEKEFSNNKTEIDFTQHSLSKKRGLYKVIEIKQKQILSTIEQFDRVQTENKAYKIQATKFGILSKGKDGWYPPESKHLFKEYQKVLRDLRPYLRLMEKNLKKELEEKNIGIK